MKKPNKYNYLFVVQGYYSKYCGWEDVCAAEHYIEARDDLKAYRENEPEYRHRMIRRRELATVAEPNSSSITTVP